jgi:multifunctional methyltransferase subunit TRM112
LQAMHNLLLDIHVIDGTLICPETGRRFPIAERIPNMM